MLDRIGEFFLITSYVTNLNFLADTLKPKFFDKTIDLCLEIKNLSSMAGNFFPLLAELVATSAIFFVWVEFVR